MSTEKKGCPDGTSTHRITRIDCHTHILPRSLPKDYFLSYEQINPDDEKLCACKRKKVPDYVSFEPNEETGNVKMYKNNKFFREVEPNCFYPHARFQDMERTDVDVQVLSTVPVMFSYWDNKEDAIDLSQRINDDLLEIVQEHPTKFIALGTLPMPHPEAAVEELKRIMSKGMAGIEIGSNVQKLQLSDPKFFPVFKACEELGACVFIHPWDMPRPKHTEKYWLPWLVGMPAETSMAICSLIFGGILEKLPKLRVMFAHGGGSFPGTIGRIEHGYHCRPDLVQVDNTRNPREYLKRFWVDSLVHDEAALDNLVSLFGTKNIVMGSDYPFPLGEQEPGKLVVESSKLTLEEKKDLLWNNAFDWLGIPAKKYGSDMTPRSNQGETERGDTVTSNEAGTTTTSTPETSSAAGETSHS